MKKKSSKREYIYLPFLSTFFLSTYILPLLSFYYARFLV